MLIQITLLLKLDTDHPYTFPRHAEMAVKWKHPTLALMLVFFFCILCPSAELFFFLKEDL